MAFIRTKRQGDREYAYVVETYWDPGRGAPRQRVLAYLGPAGEVRAEQVPEALRGEPAVTRWLRRRGVDRARPGARQLERARDKLRTALLAADRPVSEATAREVLDMAGPWGFLEDVLTPVLHGIGEDWYAGRVTVADEHAVTRGASHLVWTLRQELRPSGAASRGAKARVLLANPEGEMHSLALDVLECRLVALGHDTLVLAGGLPPRDLAARAAAHGADLVLLSATLPSSATASVHAAEAVLGRCPGALVALGGQAWRERPRPRALDDRVVIPREGPDALDALLRGLRSSPSAAT